jgi:hypothetical protein
MVGKRLFLHRYVLVWVFGLLIQACATEGPGSGLKSGVATREPAADEIPTGAIPVDQDLYQVPIGMDDEGCPMFRMYSPTRLVPQAVYYRDASGGFTTNRQAAACAGAPPG